MTNSDAMVHECLDEVEEVLRSYRHRNFDRDRAWATTLNRAFKLDGRVITMHLTVDVTAVATPEPSDDNA